MHKSIKEFNEARNAVKSRLLYDGFQYAFSTLDDKQKRYLLVFVNKYAVGDDSFKVGEVDVNLNGIKYFVNNMYCLCQYWTNEEDVCKKHKKQYAMLKEWCGGRDIDAGLEYLRGVMRAFKDCRIDRKVYSRTDIDFSKIGVFYGQECCS